MLDKKIKERIIEKYKTHPTDTGSTEIQIALLTEEIKQLTGHLRKNKKDHSSRRGLLRKVNERRRLLKYLEKENLKSYEEIVVKLKLKKAPTTPTAVGVKAPLTEEEEDFLAPPAPAA